MAKYTKIIFYSGNQLPVVLTIPRHFFWSVSFCLLKSQCNFFVLSGIFQTESWDDKTILLQVIIFEIDCAIFYTNLHDFFCQFISWTNWVNSGKFMNNCWISCQVMADMKKVYDDLIIINLLSIFSNFSCIFLNNNTFFQIWIIIVHIRSEKPPGTS